VSSWIGSSERDSAPRRNSIQWGSIDDREEEIVFFKRTGVKFFWGGEQSLRKEWEFHNDLLLMIFVKPLD
jgi:hypothetical protein